MVTHGINMLKTCAALTLACVLISSIAFAQEQQRLTIPEALQQAGKSVVGMQSVPSGPVPSVADVLKDADTIVRGTVTGSRSFLSDDQRDVYTEYVVRDVTFLHQITAPTNTAPGIAPVFKVRVHGGAVTIGTLTYTFYDQGLPLLNVGSEYLMLVKNQGDYYSVAGDYLGVFSVAGGRLTPATGKGDFAAEYSGASAADVQGTLAQSLSTVTK
jgi:hypothetical protein